MSGKKPINALIYLHDIYFITPHCFDNTHSYFWLLNLRFVCCALAVAVAFTWMPLR